MGIDGALAQQAEAVVDVQVTAAPREQLRDPGDLAAVLGHVAVHVSLGIFRGELTRLLQLGLARGRGKARRDGVAQPADALPTLDQRAAVRVAGLWRVEEDVRRIAIHQHLAGDHAQLAGSGGAKEGIDGLRMHRREHQRRGSSVAQQLVEEHLRNLRGMGGVRETRLDRKGVALQPLQQLFAVGRDHIRLRIVDMAVDETGQD